MKKSLISFACGICTGFILVMCFLHRKLIMAAIKGEKLPETPENCPAFRK